MSEATKDFFYQALMIIGLAIFFQSGVRLIGFENTASIFFAWILTKLFVMELKK